MAVRQLHSIYCRVIIPVFTGVKSIIIVLKIPELQSKTKWYIFMAHCVCISYLNLNNSR